METINLAITLESEEIIVPDFETQCKRVRYYSQHFSHVSPQPVYLGLEKKHINKGGDMDVPCYAYIVPLRESLETLLNIPIINKYCNLREENDEIQFYDGRFFSSPDDDIPTIFLAISSDEVSYTFLMQFYENKHSSFISRQFNQPSFNDTLELSIFFDLQIEIVCPIGPAKKAHKLYAGLYEILNVPPSFRSPLHLKQMLFLSKSKFVRNHGICSLLSDFVSTMKEGAVGIRLGPMNQQ